MTPPSADSDTSVMPTTSYWDLLALEKKLKKSSSELASSCARYSNWNPPRRKRSSPTQGARRHDFLAMRSPRCTKIGSVRSTKAQATNAEASMAELGYVSHKTC